VQTVQEEVNYLLHLQSLNLCEQVKLKIAVHNIQLRLFPENKVIKGPND